MRIAMIMDAWDPIVGGGQVHVRNLCQKLVEYHGCEIDLFVRALHSEDGTVYDRDEVLLDGKMRILRCGRPRWFFYFPERILSIFSIFFRIRAEHKERKYDIVHAHAFLGLLSGKLASVFLRIPIVATVHGANLLDRGEKTFFYFIEKWLLTGIRYDMEITVGSSFLRYPNVNKNVVVIPNGVNPEEFDQMDILPREDIYKILFVGRLEWTKGIDILIEAVRLLVETKKSLVYEKRVEFHLVGYGYEENMYVQLVQNLNLSDSMRFRWKITWKDLIYEYKSSDLFVLPSRSEGFGIVILEAMAAWVPVISTRCGGPEDIIDDGVNGFLVDKDNPGMLAQRIIDCIWQDSSELDVIRENAYKTVESRYTWDKIALLTFNEYMKLWK